MYKLLVKGNEGKWEIADFGDDMPYMNFSTFEIPNVDKRPNNYSQDLRLPLTPTNRRLFGYADLFECFNRIQYQLLDCRLYDNDIEIAGQGAKLRLLGIKNNTFSCQIISGLIDLFSKLKDAPIDGVDLGRWTYDQDAFINNSDPNCRFALCSVIKGKPVFKQYDPSDTDTPVHQLTDIYMARYNPFVKVSHLVETLVSHNGYTLDTAGSNLTDFAEYNQAYLSMGSRKLNQDSFRPFCAGDAENADYAGATYKGVVADGFNRYKLQFDIKNDAFGCFSGPDDFSYRPPTSCETTIYVDLDRISGPAPDKIYIQLYGDGIDLITPEISGSYRQAFKLPKDGSLFFSLYYEYLDSSQEYPAPTDVIQSCNISLTLSECDVNIPLPLHATVPVNINLGFDKQLDLLKAILFSFGAIAMLDNARKTVRFYTFKKITDNYHSRNFVDWSDKLHLDDSISVSFMVSDYAQNNNVTFQDNSADGITDKGVIKIDNQNIAPQKDLIKIDFEAGYDGHYSSVPNALVANLPYVAVSNRGTDNADYSFEGGKPHLVVMSDKWQEVKIYDDENNFINKDIEVNYYCVSHLKADHIVEKFYSELRDYLLRDMHYLEAKLLLNENDIATFDPNKPVYIHYFGCLFYVSKINHYQSGKLTLCDLFRITKIGLNK